MPLNTSSIAQHWDSIKPIPLEETQLKDYVSTLESDISAAHQVIKSSFQTVSAIDHVLDKMQNETMPVFESTLDGAISSIKHSCELILKDK
ncbi:hypothetical protein GEMRC1_006908 [Eukaryota sp. GEM-RC1]